MGYWSMMAWFPAVLALILASPTLSDPPAPAEGPPGTEPAPGGGLSLTPWWPLYLGEGEQASVDCGAPNGGDPVSVTVRWEGPDGEKIATDKSDRIFYTVATKNGNKTSAFTVATLTLKNLTLNDAGKYACVAEKITGNKTKEYFTLNVFEKGVVCGFESADLCGWTLNSSSSLAWHRHHAWDREVIAKEKGARFDHTYGASKHIGNFMDLDSDHHQEIEENATAVLISPTYPPHGGATKCFSFAYYIYEKYESDVVHLRVVIHKKGVHDVISTVTGDEEPKWTEGKVDIPPQSEEYQIVIEATLCGDKCRKAVVSVDDVMLMNGSCKANPNTWPKNELRVRLVDGENCGGYKNESKYRGRVEILHDGQWGSVCARKFGNKEAKVICRSLGYPGALDTALGKRNATFGESPQGYRIWLKELQCKGVEADLGECLAANETWGKTGDCTHGEDASVICDGMFFTCPTTTPVAITTSSTTTTTVKTTTQLPGTIKPNTTTTINPTTTSVSVTTDNDTAPLVPLKPATIKPPSTTTISSTTTAASTTIKRSTAAPTASPSPAVVKTTTTESNKNKSTTTPSVVRPTKTIATPTGNSSEAGGPDGVALEGGTSHAGVVIGVIIVILVVGSVVMYVVYRRKRKGKKSTYITFGNPSYSREHLPANDFSLESPLTLSSNGYTVLA